MFKKSKKPIIILILAVFVTVGLLFPSRRGVQAKIKCLTKFEDYPLWTAPNLHKIENPLVNLREKKVEISLSWNSPKGGEKFCIEMPGVARGATEEIFFDFNRYDIYRTDYNGVFKKITIPNKLSETTYTDTVLLPADFNKEVTFLYKVVSFYNQEAPVFGYPYLSGMSNDQQITIRPDGSTESQEKTKYNPYLWAKYSDDSQNGKDYAKVDLGWSEPPAGKPSKYNVYWNANPDSEIWLNAGQNFDLTKINERQATHYKIKVEKEKSTIIKYVVRAYYKDSWGLSNQAIVTLTRDKNGKLQGEVNYPAPPDPTSVSQEIVTKEATYEPNICEKSCKANLSGGALKFLFEKSYCAVMCAISELLNKIVEWSINLLLGAAGMS